MGGGPNCVGYMPLSSQNAYHIIVHSSANYGPHLINPLDKFNFSRSQLCQEQNIMQADC